MTPSILLGWSGILGVLAGLVVSAAATEELPTSRRALRLAHDIAFLLAASLILPASGFLAVGIGLLILTAALATTPDRQAHQLTTLLFTIILILSWKTPFFLATAGLFFIAGLTAAGTWLGNNPALVKKGCLSRPAVSSALHEFALTITPPLALLPLIL